MISEGFNTIQRLDESPSADAEVVQKNTKSKAPSGSRTPLLPDLSASTQEILARVQAESLGGSMRDTSTMGDNLKDSPIFADNLITPNSITHSTAQFQRPRMGSGIFDKSKLKSAFASALIPKSKALPSQPLKNANNQSSDRGDTSIVQNSALQSEETPQPAPQITSAGPPSMRSDESTIEVMPSPAKLAPVNPSPAGASSLSKPTAEKTETPKPKTRRNHTYILPNGEIVNSGKGLGRGRPGIKRGPRKPRPNATPTLSETKPMSRKRKRSSVDSDAENGQKSRSPSPSATDSGDEYTPDATQTRSGRHIQRPTAFVPPESPSSKKLRVNERSSTSLGKLPIKRKIYKGKEQNALCEHCLRGNGPLGNFIVFCDGCNKCWHQKCHDPRIPRSLVMDANSEWFCKDCAAIKAKATKVGRTKKAEGAPVHTEDSTTAPPSSADTARRDYFNSLPKERLVDLLMQASTLAPDLPTWRSPPPAPPPPQPTTARPPSSTKEDAYPTPKNESTDPEDEYDEHEDEHAKLYPKPGNGVQLPPESEDMHMLLEGPDSRTFSHSLREGIVGVAAKS